MEKERTEKLKEIFLAGFVMVCVALICVSWFNAFVNKDIENPYFYRGTPDLSKSYYTTHTAIAGQTPSGTGTPMPGQKHAKESQTPSPTPADSPTPEADN